MNTRQITAGVILLLSVVGGDDLIACGDKFLVPSRGTRFELSPSARREAMVLVYANPASALPNTLARLTVEPVLRKAGYRPTIVGSTDDLGEAMRRGGWDVVLVDVVDGPSVKRGAAGTDAPLILAVAQNLTGTEVAQARKQYSAVLRSPNRSEAFVDAIDEAVALRRDAQVQAAKRARR